jgi:hypothetical protein
LANSRDEQCRQNTRRATSIKQHLAISAPIWIFRSDDFPQRWMIVFANPAGTVIASATGIDSQQTGILPTRHPWRQRCHDQTNAITGASG